LFAALWFFAAPVRVVHPLLCFIAALSLLLSTTGRRHLFALSLLGNQSP
jgi:hypothetical protein